MYEDQYGEFICGHWGLQGLIDVWLYHSKWKKKTAVPMLFSMIYLNIMWMSIQSTSHENKQQKLM